MNKRKEGFYFEELACKDLCKDFKIIKRNFYTKVGEIDIIMISKDTIRFVEVKSSIYEKSCLEYLITKSKKNSLLLSSQQFLYQNPSYKDYIPAFDIVFINKETLIVDYMPDSIYFDDI